MLVLRERISLVLEQSFDNIHLVHESGVMQSAPLVLVDQTDVRGLHPHQAIDLCFLPGLRSQKPRRLRVLIGVLAITRAITLQDWLDVFRSVIDRNSALVVTNIFLGPVLQQQLQDLGMLKLCRNMQSSSFVLITNVGICLFLQQSFDHIMTSNQGRMVKRSPSILVLGVQISAVLHQLIQQLHPIHSTDQMHQRLAIFVVHIWIKVLLEVGCQRLVIARPDL
mmetsp:Transcript_76172/g.203598  ORF Transcript_76172/g.203598 Transcript_76172/m.203598 type:complete len:223 (-) Transcript_76172:153-821(-)